MDASEAMVEHCRTIIGDRVTLYIPGIYNRNKIRWYMGLRFSPSS